MSNDVAYYTHTSDNWHGKAYFRPAVENGQLIFNIIRPADQNISTTIDSYYHEHLTDTFLNHFDNAFSVASPPPDRSQRPSVGLTEWVPRGNDADGMPHGLPTPGTRLSSEIRTKESDMTDDLTKRGPKDGSV